MTVKFNKEEFEKLFQANKDFIKSQYLDDGDDTLYINFEIPFKDHISAEKFITMIKLFINASKDNHQQTDIKEFTKILKIANKFGINNINQEDINSLIFVSSIIENLRKKNS